MLIDDVKQLQNAPISKVIEKRLGEFNAIQRKSPSVWFSELCFCILTANSKAKTAIAIQKELGTRGFIGKTQEELSDVIRSNKHRFHNNKSKFIVQARDFIGIKKIVKSKVKYIGLIETRNWIAENIKGIGYKEASHYLRNIGYTNVAILDRHILNLLVAEGYLETKPKTLTKKVYINIEQIFRSIADELDMNLSELDLYMWYIKTGEVLK